MISHDHNFKNVFLDFPKEALEWILPDIPAKMGKICHVGFIRQEPEKRRLTDAHLSLDMPILYDFEKGQVLLWLVKILLPKMNYEAGDRTEVIMQAYRGLYDLVAPILFYKYLDFIDVYANVREDERDAIFHEMTEQEDTAMLAQYIKDMGFKEGELKGKLEGKFEGKLEGKLEGGRMFLERLLTRRFGPLPDWGRDQLANATLEQLDRWAERALDADSIQAVLAE